MTNPPKMSDVPMYPQPPSNEDGFFGRSEPDFDQNPAGEGQGIDENSWLLDEGAADAEAPTDEPSYEAVQSLPGEFNERLDTIEADVSAIGDAGGYDLDRPEDTLDAFAEGLTKTDPMLGASFVEPEPATRAFSRALVPAGAALLVSFCGIAVWAFMKKPVTDSSPADIEVAAPDVVDTLEGKNVDMVTPLGLDDPSTKGRISFQRDGSTKQLGGRGGGSAATVTSPREPGELPSRDQKGRKSYSAFGATKAAVQSKNTVDVEEASEGSESNTFVDAVGVNEDLDHAVASTALDTFGGLEDDMFLPQEFMDSFVLSIDPIEDVASIYGDINTRDESDSFASLGFAHSDPFDSQGFGDFGVSQWEGMGEDPVVADAGQYEVFLPFGMFGDELDSSVASVEVGPEVSVTAVSTDMEELPIPADEMGQEISSEATELAELSNETVATEIDDLADGMVEEDPLLALFGMPEDVEPLGEVMVPDAEVEETTAVAEESLAAAEIEELMTLEDDGVVEEVAPAADVTDLSLWLPVGSDASEPEVVAPVDLVAQVEVLEEAPEEVTEIAAEDVPAADLTEFPSELTAELTTAEPQAPVEETFNTELKSDLDIASAHARLDSMFQTAEPEAVASVEEVEVEVEAETLLADESAETIAPDPVTSEVVDEPVQVAIEMPAEETVEVAAEVATEETIEEPIEGLVAEVEPEPAVEPTVEPAPMAVASVTPESAEVEIFDAVVDQASTDRYGSALRRTDSSNVWSNRTVPKSKIGGDKFVLTPNVGNVRIIFDGGESIDGRLHGVGAQKVVLDTKLGRMTLDARRADRIDRLGGGKRVELRSPSDSYASTKGLDRVKVRAAGGVFYGHLIAQTEDKVTLMLDEGVRVTLNSSDVETAKARKTTSRLRKR